MTIRERIISFIISIIIAIGIYLILTSKASGANNFPVPVLAELIPTGKRSEARESTKTPAPKAGILAAGNSFLDAIERVESNGNAQAIGDNGRARGPFQFWAMTWQECSSVRSSRGQSVADYWSATNRVIARSYAATYLGKLNTYLTTALKRTPTHTELYCAWNLGPSGFKRRGFSLARCPASTRAAAARINSTLALSKGVAASSDPMQNVASVAGMARR